MKLQIFTIKKFLSQTLIILVYLFTFYLFNHTALKKDKNCYPQVFLKECKYIDKRVIRYINNNLSDFSSSNESDKEYIRISSLLKKLGLCFTEIQHIISQTENVHKKVYNALKYIQKAVN